MCFDKDQTKDFEYVKEIVKILQNRNLYRHEKRERQCLNKSKFEKQRRFLFERTVDLLKHKFEQNRRHRKKTVSNDLEINKREMLQKRTQ